MISQLKTRQLNAIIYVDYENVMESLRLYGKDPLEMNFFKIIQTKLAATGLSIIDTIIFGNFEKNVRSIKQQSYLRTFGFQTRHTSNNGKNSGDLELTVNALRDLYKNPNIDVFVIISSGQDSIPLLKEIKYANKLSYVISTQNGVNQIVARYADFHEYIEDIFGLAFPKPRTIDQDPVGTLNTVDPKQIIQQAREVARYFYQSHIWKSASSGGKPVNLNGYADVVARIVNRCPDQIIEDFKMAHCMKLITIYSDPENGLCVKEGSQMGKIIS